MSSSLTTWQRFVKRHLCEDITYEFKRDKQIFPSNISFIFDQADNSSWCAFGFKWWAHCWLVGCTPTILLRWRWRCRGTKIVCMHYSYVPSYTRKQEGNPSFTVQSYCKCICLLLYSDIFIYKFKICDS